MLGFGGLMNLITDKLSQIALQAIQKASSIGIPSICCWELAMLVSKQRLGLSIDVEIWVDMALQREKVKLLPLSPEISILSTRLANNFHGDPADRLVVASGLFYKC